MLRTVADIERHYASFKEHLPATIAVGCLRWKGRGEERTERLVAVLKSSEEMRDHLALVRNEEWEFTKRNFSQPKIVHKLKLIREGGRK